jgi:hypothetical protein
MLLLASAPACGNLIVNGGFEIPYVGPTGYSLIWSGPGPAGFGWIVNSGNVEVQGELYPGCPGPAFEGIQFLDLNGILVGTISQTFATIPGEQYLLQFAYANNHFHANTFNPASMIILVFDPSSHADPIETWCVCHGTSTPADLDWRVLSSTFRATSWATTLRFISTTRDDLGGILLDGISVTGKTSAIPEPSSRISAALGLAGLAAYAAWKRCHADIGVSSVFSTGIL